MVSPLESHPNTSRSVGGGAGAIAVVWILGYLGVDLTAEAGAALATIAGGALVFIGRDGVKGAILRLWHGQKTP